MYLRFGLYIKNPLEQPKKSHVGIFYISPYMYSYFVVLFGNSVQSKNWLQKMYLIDLFFATNNQKKDRYKRTYNEENMVTPEGNSFSIIQASSYMIIYEDKDGLFKPDMLKQKLIAEGCKFVTLDIYYSKYELSYGMDLKNLYLGQTGYYYVHLVFGTRQKLHEDSSTKNLILPRYYEYQPKWYGKVLEKNSSLENKDSVLYMLRYLIDQNFATLYGRFQNETTSLTKNNLEYHFYKILELENEEQLFSYVQSNNLYYFLDSLFSKLRTLLFFNNQMSNKDEDFKVPQIPFFLIPYIETFEGFTQKSETSPIIPATTITQNESSISSVLMKESEDYALNLEGQERPVLQALETDVYSLELGIKIFSSENVRFSPMLDKIAKDRRKNTSESKKETEGYKFIFYQKGFINLPYRNKNPNLGLSKIYLFFSKDYKEKYFKYLSEEKKSEFSNLNENPENT